MFAVTRSISVFSNEEAGRLSAAERGRSEVQRGIIITSPSLLMDMRLAAGPRGRRGILLNV